MKTGIKSQWLFCVFFFFILSASAQKLELPIKLDVDRGSTEGISLTIIKNGKSSSTQTTSKNIKLKLDFNQNYTLSFSKQGYITKSIEVNTSVTEDRIKQGFEPYKIGIQLFEQKEENEVMYNQPVGKIRYDAALDEFNFETDYSKSILSAFNDPEPEKSTAKSQEQMAVEKTSAKNAAHETPVSVEEKNLAVVEAIEKTKQETIQNAALIKESPTPAPAKNEKKEKSLPLGDNNIAEGSFVAADHSNLSGNAYGTDLSEGAKSNHAEGQDLPPLSAALDPEEKITREDIKEKNRIIIKVKVSSSKKDTYYSVVQYNWGGRFFFHENRSISENNFTVWTGIQP